MWDDFVKKVSPVDQKSDIALMLNPIFQRLPVPIARYDDPFFPFVKEIIRATQDLVPAYVFVLAAYLTMGAAGAVALEPAIRFVDGDAATILHGAFVGRGFSAMCDVTGFGGYALTLTQITDLPHYLGNPPYAAFVTQKGKYNLAETPTTGGIFWQDSSVFSLRDNNTNVITLRVTDDNILYAGKLDDFAQIVRESVKALL